VVTEGGDAMPMIFKPQAGPQEQFMAASADIVIYGG